MLDIQRIGVFEEAEKIEMEDARLYKRFRKIRWFIDKTRSEEEQKDSLVKVVRDHILRDLLTQLRVNKSLLAIWAGIIIMLIFTISVPAYVLPSDSWCKPHRRSLLL